MQGLVRKSAVQFGLVVALLVALTYGVLTPAGSARATGQGALGANGTPVAVGTPIAPPPAPPAPPEPAPAAPIEATAPAIPASVSPSESAPAASPAPSDTPPAPPPTATPAAPAPATPQLATPTFPARPAPARTPVATPTAAPVWSAPATPRVGTVTGTAPAASPTPTMRFTPTPTPTRLPSGSVSASIVRDLSPLSFTLNGRDQIARATLELEVGDTAPATRQPGWSLSLSVDQFRIAGNSSRALPIDAVTLLGVTVACVGEAACTMPENSVAYPLTMPAGAAVEIVTAAPGSGGGRFIVTPIVAVRVPATAYAGSYTTAIAVDIAGGTPVLAAQVQDAPPATVEAVAVLPLPTGTAMATPTPLAAPPMPTAPEPLQASLTTPPAVTPAPPSAPEPVIAPEPIVAPDPEPTPEPVAPAPTPSPAAAFPATDRIGTTQAVNLRTDPAATSRSQGLLPTGTRLAATGATRLVAGVLWRHFTLADGRTGWVRDLDVLPVAR